MRNTMCSTASRSEPAALVLAARSITEAQPGPAIHASADWLTDAPAPTTPRRSISWRRVRNPLPLSSGPGTQTPLVRSLVGTAPAQVLRHRDGERRVDRGRG